MSIKAIEGENGFLFLGNDTNSVFDQITAKKNLSPSMIQRWGSSINDRVDFCKKNGCEYFIFIAPNKHCVYREFLPEGFFVSDNRIARQLEKLSSRVFYPCSILREYTNCLTYHKLDTQWNEVGCCIAWNEFFRSKLGCTGLEISSVKEVKTGPGDLGSKIDPKMHSYAYRVELEHTSKTSWDNLLENRGRTRIFQNSKPNRKRAIIFGDSFSDLYLNRIADYFSETYFFHTPFFYKDVVKRLSPDVVINANVERFFYSPHSTIGTIASDFLQYFWDGKYDNANLKKFINVLWNEVFPRDVYDNMCSIAVNFIDTYNHFECNNVDELLKADSGQSLLERMDELITYKPLPLFFYYKCVLQTKSGDFLAASKSIERALDSCPRSAAYLFKSSSIFSNLGMSEQAIQKVQDAIAAKDDNPHFYSHLGNLLRNIGDLEGAKEAQEKAIAIDPSIPGPHVQLSHIYNQLGDDLERNIHSDHQMYGTYLTSLTVFVAFVSAFTLSITRGSTFMLGGVLLTVAGANMARFFAILWKDLDYRKQVGIRGVVLMMLLATAGWVGIPAAIGIFLANVLRSQF